MFKNTIIALLLPLVGLLSAPVLKAQSVQADDIIGEWLSAQKDGKISIYKTATGKYEGKISWGSRLNTADSVDHKNPDVALRARKRLGMVLLRDFTYKGDNDWAGGKIYDPDTGSDYKCYMKLEDDGKDKNTLRVRGYVGISILGRTEKFTRVQ